MIAHGLVLCRRRVQGPFFRVCVFLLVQFLGVRVPVLSIRAASLLRSLGRAGKGDVLGFFVETFNPHMDVPADIGMCVVDMALEGATQSIWVQWHVAPARWMVGAGFFSIFRDGAAVYHTRFWWHIVKAAMASSLTRHGIYHRDLFRRQIVSSAFHHQVKWCRAFVGRSGFGISHAFEEAEGNVRVVFIRVFGFAEFDLHWLVFHIWALLG